MSMTQKNLLGNVNVNYEQMCDNLVSYYKWERATSVDSIPTTKYALELIVETYEKIGNQPELVNVAKNRLQLWRHI